MEINEIENRKQEKKVTKAKVNSLKRLMKLTYQELDWPRKNEDSKWLKSGIKGATLLAILQK